MSAAIVPMTKDATVTVDELGQFFFTLNMGGYHRIAVTRSVRDDVTRPFLMVANALAARRRPVRIVCADSVAARRYRARIAADPQTYGALDGDCVTTARELALGVFPDARVVAGAHRSGRVLDANEMDVLMEDVKVSGIKPGRLREMLKFFYKSMADCSAEQDGWLETGEEKKVFSILQENLEARDAMLPAELFGLAWRGMMDGKVGRGPMLVLCDDWGGLSASAQRFVELLATEGLIAAGTTSAMPSADEPYPNPEGFAALARRPHIQKVFVRSEAGLPRMHWSAAETPGEEVRAAAMRIAERVGAGADPAGIMVAVPNAAWARAVASELAAAGVGACVDLGPGKVKGDPRYPESAQAVKAAALEKLRENPADRCALRTYLGAGDWLLRSDAFLGLLAYAREHELSLEEAIGELRSQPADERELDIFRKFDNALDELDELGISYCGSSADAAAGAAKGDAAAGGAGAAGDAAAAAAETLRGEPVGASDSSRIPAKPGNSEADEPASMSNAAYAPGCVTVAPYRRCRSLRGEAVFVLGMVNGFLPAADAVDDAKFTIDHRRSALARESALFSDLCDLASGGDVFASRFKSDLYKPATLAHAQVTRVFAKDGERWARIAPSTFSPDGAPLPDVVIQAV